MSSRATQRSHDRTIRYVCTSYHEYDGSTGYDVKQFTAPGKHDGRMTPQLAYEIQCGLRARGWPWLSLGCSTADEALLHPDGKVLVRFQRTRTGKRVQMRFEPYGAESFNVQCSHEQTTEGVDDDGNLIEPAFDVCTECGARID